MRCNLHQCLRPEEQDQCDGQCDDQLQLGLIKLCKRKESDCPLFAINPLGKMEPEDFLLP